MNTTPDTEAPKLDPNEKYESGGVDLDAIRKKIKHAQEDANGWDEYAKPLTGRAYFNAVGAASTLNDLADSLTALLAEVERLRLSESEIRRDQAEKDAKIAEEYGNRVEVSALDDYKSRAYGAGKQKAATKITGNILDQFLALATQTEQEPRFLYARCDGSGRCSALYHVHGCFTEHGRDACDTPDAHDSGETE